MALLVLLVVVLALVVLAGGVAGGVILANRARRNFQARQQASNQVVPGRVTRAPESWLGSHDPEAVLHRRLRDAMAALRANDAFDNDGALLEVRVELEEQALALDDQLVSVAAVPRLHRSEPLARVTEAVAMIEKAVSELATRSALESAPRLDAVLDRIKERVSLIDEIRTELDRLPAPAGSSAPAEPSSSPVAEAPSPAGEVSGPASRGSRSTGTGGSTGTGSATAF